MDPIRIRPGKTGRLVVLFRYHPERVAKIKTVADRRWHPEGNCWTVPHTNEAIARLLVLFAGEPVDVEPSLHPERPLGIENPLPGPGIPQATESDPGTEMAQVRQAIRARHYSPSTEQAYVAWIKRFIAFHGQRHPAEMGEPDVNRFLTHLAVQDRVAASTQNQALAALLFLYGKVLNRPLGKLEGVVRARRPRRGNLC